MAICWSDCSTLEIASMDDILARWQLSYPFGVCVCADSRNPSSISQVDGRFLGRNGLHCLDIKCLSVIRK